MASCILAVGVIINHDNDPARCHSSSLRYPSAWTPGPRQQTPQATPGSKLSRSVAGPHRGVR